MRGFGFLSALIVILVVVVAAAVVAPAVTGTVSPGEDSSSGDTVEQGTLQSPQTPQSTTGSDEPEEPPILVVDDIRFCKELSGGECSTHSTSFTNLQRVYATVDYSQAEIDEFFAFSWYKKTGARETELAGDGQGIEQESGSLTTSLTSTNEDQPLSQGTYVFKIFDSEDTILDEVQFVIN